MDYNEKLVTWRHLKPGMEVCGVKYAGGASYFRGEAEKMHDPQYSECL